MYDIYNVLCSSTASHQSDSPILNDNMHVPWARGQEPGNYVHRPRSGHEAGEIKNTAFYTEDELKYHGHGMQRGVAQINFFGKYMVLQN